MFFYYGTFEVVDLKNKLTARAVIEQPKEQGFLDSIWKGQEALL